MNHNSEQCDPSLGQEVHQHLLSLGFETPMTTDAIEKHLALLNIRVGIEGGLSRLGLDMTNPSLRDTPKRYARMLVEELCAGLDYSQFPKCTAVPNGQEVSMAVTGVYDEMVLVRDIQVISLCEHHLQTIDGYAHVAYIPKTKVLGLSKFARVVDFFARRPQVQERLTMQVYHALSLILETDDVAVVIKATHFCMKARGTLQHASTTQTNKMGGRFMTVAALRQEMLDALR